MKKLLSLLIIICLILSFSVTPVSVGASGKLVVSFIDSGQGDSILLQQGNYSMLIDAGGNKDENIIPYIKSKGIKKLDYVVATHPHLDHISQMDEVINTFTIGKVYAPKVTANTNTFEDFIDAVESKNLKITTPVPGSSFKLGTATCKILAPNSADYTDLNNYSIVLKITYGKTSFLFSGDAEDISEKEMISKGYDLKADVLKVGHHSSQYSSTEPFIKKVSPKIAVITVGKNNYGHPAKSTLDRLSVFKVKTYTTMNSGTIIITSDGKAVSVDKKASAIKPNAPPTSSTSDVTVYITNSGTKYHNSGCSYLSSSKISIKLKDAKSKSYTPCSRCNPPK